MAFELDPACPVSTELVRVIREMLTESIEIVADQQKGATQRIHTGRTACKKTRAALKLLRSHNREFYRRENAWLRDSAKELSNLRDNDILTQTLLSLLKHEAGGVQRRKLEPVHRALLKQRRRSALSAPDFERTMSRFVDRLRQADKKFSDWKPTGGFSALVKDFQSSYKRARLALRSAQTTNDAAAFHEWRKATKACTYQCRLLRAASPETMNVLCANLKELSRQLGAEHDLTILISHLRKLPPQVDVSLPAEALANTIDLAERRRAALRAEAIPLGERIFADRPRAVAERIARWWRVARENPRKKK